MTYDDVCNLISVTYSTDDRGVKTKKETTRTIYCKQKSIGQSEYFKAQAEGLNPTIVLCCDFEEYQSEKYAKYKDVDYGIYRTFTQNGITELYLTLKAGV